MRITELIEDVRHCYEQGDTEFKINMYDLITALEDAGYTIIEEEDEPWILFYRPEDASYTYMHRDRVSDREAVTLWESERFATEEKAKHYCEILNEMRWK